MAKTTASSWRVKARQLTRPTPQPENTERCNESADVHRVGQKAGWSERVARTVPSMRRNGRPTVVCQFCGDFSIKLLIVCEHAT